MKEKGIDDPNFDLDEYLKMNEEHTSIHVDNPIL